MLAQLLTLLPLLALTSASPIAKRADARLIESARNGGFCLSVQGGRAAVAAGQVGNGTPVVTLACGAASFWDISKGSGSAVVSGTTYALDIGMTPGNSGAVKAWTSYPGSTQQTWYLTDDNRIAQTGGNQCLDQGANGPQTYQCTAGNTNQVWFVRFDDPTPSASASLSSSSSAPSASSTPPASSRKLIESGRNAGLCLSVQGGRAAVAAGSVGDGTPVGTLACDVASYWDIAKGSGSVIVSGTEFALDIGLTPGNDGALKAWTSYPGSTQQTWYLTDDNRIAQTGGNQCLDQGAYGPQTYQCTAGNTNQVWNVRNA